MVADRHGSGQIQRRGSDDAGFFNWKRRGKRYRAYTQMRAMMQKGGFLLLWVAVGLDVIISIMGHPIAGQALSASIVSVYLLYTISLRRLVCNFWFTVIDFFFREISVGGETKLEALRDGRATIFCVAPHVNQFIDPIVVMKVVAEQTQRHVSWMTAAKTMDRKYIGAFAKALKCIPVARPDDMIFKGTGTLTVEGDKVTGHGTKFESEVQKGAVIKVVLSKDVTASGKVLLVHSDTSISLSGPMRRTVRKAKPVHDLDKSYNRALSPLLTILVFASSFLVCVIVFPMFIPGRFLMLEYMLSFQVSCLSTHLIYATIRDGIPHSASLGEYVRDNLISYRGSGRGKKQGGDEAKDGTDASTPLADEEEHCDIGDQKPYTILPFVDQSEMFEQVHEALLSGKTIGIFPEGGTHDNTEVLPLKWGVSVMVLGALARCPPGNLAPISIVPVGLNYFAPHKFRSTVSVDFGDPIQVSEELVNQFRNGSKEEKQEANKGVIDLVLHGLNACTLQAKDVRTLQLFRTLRRLFVPKGERLSVTDNVALTQGFAYGFDRIKQDPKVKEVMTRVSEYSDMLLQYKVRDHQVQRFRESSPSKKRNGVGGAAKTEELVPKGLLSLTLIRLITASILCLLLLPWWLCLAPAGLVGRVISDVQAKKVQKMSVIGTWKVLMATAVIPLLHAGYTMCFWSALGQVAGLGWLFFAPICGLIAMYSTEDSIRILQSLNGLWLLLRQSDIGQKLYEMREELHKQVRELQEEQHWLDSLDKKTRSSLDRVQVFQDTTNVTDKLALEKGVDKKEQ